MCQVCGVQKERKINSDSIAKGRRKAAGGVFAFLISFLAKGFPARLRKEEQEGLPPRCS